MKLNDFGASAGLKIKQKTKMIVKNIAAYEHENLTKVGFKVEKKVKYFEVIFLYTFFHFSLKSSLTMKKSKFFPLKRSTEFLSFGQYPASSAFESHQRFCS